MTLAQLLGVADEVRSSKPDHVSRKRKLLWSSWAALGLVILCAMGYWKLLVGMALIPATYYGAVYAWRRTARGGLRHELNARAPQFANGRNVRKFAGKRASKKGSYGAKYGTLLGYTITGPTTPRSVYIKHEDSCGFLGGTRRGKTAELANMISRHGRAPQVTMSARLDLWRTTKRAREAVGKVLLFNPTGFGRVSSNIVIDFLARCDTPEGATTRATALVRALDNGAPEQQEWLMYAAQVLRAFILAAALSGRDMYQVHAWATDTACCEVTGEDDEDLSDNPLAILMDDIRCPQTWCGELVLVMTGLGENQRGSILALVANAVAFMSNPSAARSVCPEEGDEVFDSYAFADSSDTLHIVGTGRKFDPLAPLMAALLADVFETAMSRAAENEDNGKLDRAMAMACDELGVGVMFPIDEWLAWGGGANIHVWWATQDQGQIRERYKQERADAILSTTTALVVFGGIKNHADLKKLSDMAGEKRVPIPDKDDKSRGRTEWRPLVTVEELSHLEKFTALLLHSEMRPCVIATRQWKHLPSGAPGKQVAAEGDERADSGATITPAASPFPQDKPNLKVVKVASERIA